MMNKNTAPDLRFRGFDGEWEQRKFPELTEIRSASRVHKEEWQTSGVPFYRSSDVMAALNGTENEKAFISEELYEKLSAVSGKLEKGDVLVTGGGSVGKPYIVPNNEPLYTKDADLLWIKNNKNLDPYFIYTFFFSPSFKDYLSSVSHVGTIAHYTITQLGETPITLPNVSEQQRIGVFFQNLDTLITLHQSKLEKLKNIKKSMLEKMFPKNGSLYPEIRFKGFTDAWEQRKLGECMETVTDYVAAGSFADIASNVEYRNSPDYAQLVRTVDLKHQFKNNDFIYVDKKAFDYLWRVNLNTESIVLPNIGANIGEAYYIEPSLLPYENNVLGPNAIYLKSKHSAKFMFSLFQADDFQNKLSVSVASSGQPKFNKTELKEILLTVPTADEQEKIGIYFSRLDTLITLHQRELEKLKNIKKACLEKMFV